MEISSINKIEVPESLSSHSNSLERIGDLLLTPARLFFGNTYVLEVDKESHLRLKCPENFSTLSQIISKIAAIVLLPLSILSTLFGIGSKKWAHAVSPHLAEKYSLPVLHRARSADHFSGRLPQNPWTPNCVNSQQKSLWGSLYSADPIQIPAHVSDPVAVLKNTLETADKSFYKAANAVLTEETDRYLHYEYTVHIPSGPLKGTYIDDVDIFYDKDKRQFDIRSASRVGFRDLVSLDFSIPGANKKRIESIREAFLESCPSSA